MMATRATHQLGDLSRPDPHLALIHDETDAEYIGEWVAGIGYINVRFPKSSTRELTDDEKETYRGMRVVCGGINAPIVID